MAIVAPDTGADVNADVTWPLSENPVGVDDVGEPPHDIASNAPRAAAKCFLAMRITSL
jgi:hypothetical protein